MIFKLFCVLSLSAAPALARDYDTYRSDYFKGAFCTAIGGACAADDDLVTGIFQNPAALANGESRWDFDGDYASRDLLEAGANGNNGAADRSAVGGVAYSPSKWGMGLGFSWRRSDVDTPTSVPISGGTVNSRLLGRSYTTQLRLPLAYYVGDGVSMGLTLSFTTQYQELELADPSIRVSTSPTSSKIRATFGTQFPLSPEIRIGSWLRLPITLYDHVSFTNATTGAETFREEFSLHSPWIWGTGAAWKVSVPWTLYAQVDLIGPTENGFLFSYSSFSINPSAATLKEKGRQLVLEPHAGARYQISEKTRLHLGSYYENSRWEGIYGRLHGSVGLSRVVGIFEFIAGIDAARDYTQLFFTFR